MLLSKEFEPVDIQDTGYNPLTTIAVGFKTPFTGKVLPPDFHTLVTLIRNRVIRFVNEYGNKENIPPVRASGTIQTYSEHYHMLERRSIRSSKNVFDTYTGVVTYNISELDDAGAWMVQLGFIVECGPDCSFGCGFLQKM